MDYTPVISDHADQAAEESTDNASRDEPLPSIECSDTESIDQHYILGASTIFSSTPSSSSSTTCNLQHPSMFLRQNLSNRSPSRHDEGRVTTNPWIFVPEKPKVDGAVWPERAYRELLHVRTKRRRGRGRESCLQAIESLECALVGRMNSGVSCLIISR